MHKSIAKNPKHKHAKYAKILKKLPLRVPYRWTDKQKKRFSEAVQKHGKDWRAIKKYFPRMPCKLIENRLGALASSIVAVKNHPDAHLKKTLLKGSPHVMSK